MPFFIDMLDGVDAFLNMFEYCLNTYDNSNTHNMLAMSLIL
jgi:hypothetical protein